MKRWIWILAFLSLSCLVDPDIDHASMLDGDQIFSPALLDSSYYLISDSVSTPTDSQKALPVVVAAHGFTATTFEWQEFRNFSDSAGGILVSQILLGGHGRTYDDFKRATWKDWQKPILDEYKALVQLGYTNISLAGSSTGCPLILDLFERNAFKGLPAPKRVFFIDPIVIPGSKLITLIDIIGSLVGNDISKGTPEENKNWYSVRPAEAISQLLDLITNIRKRLEDGFSLTAGTTIKVYKTRGDEVANPVSALLIYKGLRDGLGKKPDIEMLDSKLHVFTRGLGRKEGTWKTFDAQLQNRVFTEMRMKLMP